MLICFDRRVLCYRESDKRRVFPVRSMEGATGTTGTSHREFGTHVSKVAVTHQKFACIQLVTSSSFNTVKNYNSELLRSLLYARFHFEKIER